MNDALIVRGDGSPRVQSPTLLVGLGAFGRDVLARLSRDGEAVGGLALLQVGSDRSDEDVAAEAVTKIGAMLDLVRFVANTAHTDRRGPHCDLYLIADLGEDGSVDRVQPLCTALALAIRERFRPILGTGAGALVLCPILAVPRAADRGRVSAALAALGRAAEDARGRLDGRIHIIEDQSGKYVLSGEELARTFGAFLSLVLFSRLRDQALGVRGVIERPAGKEARGGPFGSFACATLELDDARVVELCSLNLSREVLARFRSGEERSIADIAARADALVIERGELDVALWRESATGSLAEHLEPPSIEVPEIDRSDSPERIVEVLFGPIWRASVARRVEVFRDEVEHFKMDRLAAGIEHNGKAVLESALGNLASRVSEEVAAGPRGHAHALEMLRDAHTRAKGRLAEVSREIESPSLTPFPDPPLDVKLTALEEAAAAYPRTYRMRVFGAIGGLVGACLTAGVILGAYRGFVSPSPSYFDAAAPMTGTIGRALTTWPMPYVLGGITMGSSTYYRLYKHQKRHFNWIMEARGDLDQALQNYLHRDVVSYFQRRLHYTRLLWVARIYARLTLAIEEAMARLEAVRVALAKADEQLEARAQALEDALQESAKGGGVLFRGLLTPPQAREVFDELRPREAAPIATRWLAESLKDEAWTAAPFARAEPLRAFCEIAFRDVRTLRPFAQVPGAPETALTRSASSALREFLRQLALKLEPSLDVKETFALGSPTPTRVLVVPPEAKDLVESMLVEDDLAAGWEVRALSSDSQRIHMLVERGDLPLEALALARKETP